jgi:hypothetical protein
MAVGFAVVLIVLMIPQRRAYTSKKITVIYIVFNAQTRIVHPLNAAFFPRMDQFSMTEL